MSSIHEHIPYIYIYNTKEAYLLYLVSDKVACIRTRTCTRYLTRAYLVSGNIGLNNPIRVRVELWNRDCQLWSSIRSVGIKFVFIAWIAALDKYHYFEILGVSHFTIVHLILILEIITCWLLFSMFRIIYAVVS